MKTTNTFLTISAIFIASLVATGANYYVDTTNGDDSNSGTLTQPFKTISKAAGLAVAGDIVYIRAGTYRETVTPANSGTAENPIVFQTYSEGGISENVTISALDEILPGQNGAGQWQQHSGNIHKIQLDSSYGNPWIVNGTPMPGRDQVFVDGVMMAEARWPDGDSTIEFNYLKSASADSGGRLDDPGPMPPYSGNGFYTGTYIDSDIPERDWTGAHIDLQPGHGWWPKTGVVTNFDNASKTISFKYLFASDWNPEYDTPKGGDPYYLWGTLAALDKEGEAFYDVQGINGQQYTLYLWKPGGGSPVKNKIEMRKRLDGFVLNDRSHIIIRGLNFLSARISTNSNSSFITIDRVHVDYAACNLNLLQSGNSAAIELYGSGHIITNSYVSNTTGMAISIRATNSTVSNCVTYNSKGHGISADHYSSGGKTIRTRNVTVSDNTVIRTGGVSIAISGWESKFLRNHCFLGGLNSTDLAMMNTWNSGNANGTEVAYNIVHDNRARRNVERKWWGGQGIRLDSGEAPIGCAGFVIHHNIVWNTTSDSSITAWGLSESQRSALGCGNDSNIHIYNNTVDDTIRISSSESAAGHRIKNNISMKFSDNSPSEATVENNLFANTEISKNENISGNPYLIMPAEHNYQLLSNSPAINAGQKLPPYTDGYKGDAPDIGAYERGNSPWSAGAYVTEDNLLSLTTTEVIGADGVSSFHVEGMPLGRRLPDSFKLKIADRESSSFHMEYDFSNDTMKVKGVCMVDISGLSGEQKVYYSLDNGKTYQQASSKVSIAAPSCAGQLTVKSGPPGTSTSIIGTRFFGNPSNFYRLQIEGLAPQELSNLAIPLVFDSKSLVDAGKMRADGGDIRFYAADGRTELEYYVESGMNTASTLVWIRYAQASSSGTNLFNTLPESQAIYLSCGRSELSTKSDADVLLESHPVLNNDMLLWLRANDLAELGNEASVSIWSDVSGKNKDASQSLESSQPKFITSVHRGLSAVRFDGNDFLDVLGGLLPEGTTSDAQLFAVYMNPTPNDTNYPRLISSGNTGSNDYTSPGFALYAQYYPEDDPNFPKKAVPQFAPKIRSAGETKRSFANLRIAKPFNNTNPDAITFNGDIFEIIVLPKKMTNDEKNELNAYLASKTGSSTCGLATADISSSAIPSLQVIVGGKSATDIVLNGNSTISFKVPPYDGPLPKTVDVVIILPDGTTYTLPDGFTYTEGPLTYILTVNGGSGSGAYSEGTMVAIKAHAPPAGMIFDQWTGDIAKLANPFLPETTLAMPASNCEISSSYRNASNNEYSLEVLNGLGSGKYLPGTAVTIKALPAPDGKAFAEWIGQTGTVINTFASGTILYMPDSDCAVEATYSDIPDKSLLAVTMLSAENGRIMTANGSLLISQTYYVAKNDTCGPFYAVPDEDYTFIGWTGALTGMDNPLLIGPVSTSMAIIANFAKARDVTEGKIIPLLPSEISDYKEKKFYAGLKVKGLYKDLLKSAQKSVALKLLTKIKKDMPVDSVQLVWTKKLPLFNKKQWNKSMTVSQNLATGIQLDSLDCNMLAYGKYPDKTKFADLNAGTVALVPPQISGIYDAESGAEIFRISANQSFFVRGIYFGVKPPAVFLEWKNEKGDIKRLRLKILMSRAEFKTLSGKSSCMEATNGLSSVCVQMPSKMPDTWNYDAKYNFVLFNGIGYSCKEVYTTNSK